MPPRVGAAVADGLDWERGSDFAGRGSDGVRDGLQIGAKAPIQGGLDGILVGHEVIPFLAADKSGKDGHADGNHVADAVHRHWVEHALGAFIAHPVEQAEDGGIHDLE